MGLESYQYDPASGEFFNRKGKKVGSYTKTYGRILHRGKEIQLSRLAFFLMEGAWPIEEVDHINGDTHNNRWNNLRKCNRVQNSQNKGKRKHNTTGYKGVYPMSYGANVYYLSKIQSNGNAYYLGSFKTPEEAAKAYNEKALELHGEFARLNEIKGV